MIYGDFQTADPKHEILNNVEYSEYQYSNHVWTLEIKYLDLFRNQYFVFSAYRKDVTSYTCTGLLMFFSFIGSSLLALICCFA